MLEGDSLCMWYAGWRNPSLTYLLRIGHATAPYFGAYLDSNGVPVGIEDYDITHTPEKYILAQNYPNPFNPSTTIEFTLPQPEYTTLTIYNILGAEVATLISDKLQTGRHSYHFDGSKLASGVYYYQVTAGDYREVKKMILLR